MAVVPLNSETDTRTFSQVIEDIGARDEPKLYLSELINGFGERGFGAMLLFFGLVSVVIGAVPGTTTVLGAPILLIAIQLVFRRDQLWMPSWILKRSIDRATYRNAIGKIMKPLRKVERLSRPRLSIMSSDASEMLIGLACIVLCLILMLPITGGNLVPSLIVAAFGFGLMQRDGAIIIAGWIGTAGFGVFVWLAWELISRVVLATWEWATTLF
ncbi:exopolysaccharide biosynthesis protein [uncultured Brevundimonas sp.]|uniref:exopolysaccharide biosynthesis protein n=1 Tax=uncultured Brevundimonas sp. TaxID=213418 RepID=UPI0025F83923|nr:exopolysaccharide biosynthesis protein [uncultured Brevundimonas sp.]